LPFFVDLKKEKNGERGKKNYFSALLTKTAVNGRGGRGRKKKKSPLVRREWEEKRRGGEEIIFL